MELNETEKPARTKCSRGLRINPGDFLLSHAVSRAVPSAPAGLTSVFGMGTGVTLPTKSPENFNGWGLGGQFVSSCTGLAARSNASKVTKVLGAPYRNLVSPAEAIRSNVQRKPNLPPPVLTSFLHPNTYVLLQPTRPTAIFSLTFCGTEQAAKIKTAG